MITQHDVANLKKWFNEHVENFRNKDREIQRNYDLKKKHTFNVCKNIVEIGKDNNLNDTDLNISEIIALFHDLGRFDQFFKYKTFADEKSENHSALAVKIINENFLLNKFDEITKKIIQQAILNHNKINIDDEKDSKILLFSKLIRDADKIDIYRVVTEYYKNKVNEKNETIELELKDTENYSEDIYNKVMNQHIAKYEDLKLSNDFKLLQLSWIYDINFLYSFKKIKKNDYITSIYNVLPKSKKITTLYNKIILYLNEKCKLSVEKN